MKLPVESGGGAAGCIKPEATEAPAVPRKRPRSAANGQGGVGPLRPPSRAMAMAPTALSWGSHLHQCAPQIAIPDARLHLAASNRPRSRYNSVRNNYFLCCWPDSVHMPMWLPVFLVLQEHQFRSPAGFCQIRT